jgi:hypothetical protein
MLPASPCLSLGCGLLHERCCLAFVSYSLYQGASLLPDGWPPRVVPSAARQKRCSSLPGLLVRHWSRSPRGARRSALAVCQQASPLPLGCKRPVRFPTPAVGVAGTLRQPSHTQFASIIASRGWRYDFGVRIYEIRAEYQFVQQIAPRVGMLLQSTKGKVYNFTQT